MTKADIVERIQSQTGLSKKDSSILMESVFSIFKESLQSVESIKISGFGSFTVAHKAARTGRNLQTGEPMIIEARKVLSFKPSTHLRLAINERHK